MAGKKNKNDLLTCTAIKIKLLLRLNIKVILVDTPFTVGHGWMVDAVFKMLG